MQKLVFINGAGKEIDLTSGNFGITNWKGLSNTELNIQSQQVPFEDGGVFLDALMEQREISVTVAIYDGNNLELRYQKKRELISALNPKLGEGTLIYTNDYLSRQIKAVPQIPLFENKNSNDAGTLKASVAFSCPSPYWEDVEERFINFSLGEVVAVDNQGDVPTAITARFFTQDATNPTIENMTTQQKIEVDTNLTKTLNINTNAGQKKVYTENVNLESIGCYGEFKDICFSKNKSMWVAVTSDGAIFYSYNGTDWNICEFDTDIIANFQGITYSEDLGIFVAVGSFVSNNNCRLASSSDGIHWINRGNYVKSLYAVTFSKELQIFVAVGEQRIIASADGIEWVEKASPYYTFYSVVYSETLEMFIAVGERALFSSADGESWTDILTSDMSGIDFKSVIFSERLGLFVAVGVKFVDSEPYFACIKSSDGASWNVSTLTSLGALYPRSVVYAEDLGLFVCVGRNYAVLTSANASDWTIIENAGSTDDFYYTVAYSKEQKKFISAGTSSKIIESTNGVDWDITQDVKGNLNGVVYSKKINMYIAVGNKGVILSSKDGKVWKSENSNTDADLMAVTYAESLGIFVAVGGKFLTSADGENWEEVYTTFYTMTGVVYAERLHLFVACGYSMTGVLIKSTDGINWEFITGFTNLGPCFSINFSEEKSRFIVGIAQSRIVTSNNGVNWTFKVLPTGTGTADIHNVTYSAENDLFFVLYGNRIIKSEDGLNWYSETISTNLSTVICVVYSSLNKTYFAIKSNGEIYSSINLMSWDKIRNAGIELYSASISAKDNVIVFVGRNGIIMRSYYSEEENKIAYLNTSSDMSFKLKNGENRIILSCQEGYFSCSLAYRQKYIGV